MPKEKGQGRALMGLPRRCTNDKVTGKSAACSMQFKKTSECRCLYSTVRGLAGGLRHFGPVPRNFPYAIDGWDWVLSEYRESAIVPVRRPSFSLEPEGS